MIANNEHNKEENVISPRMVMIWKISIGLSCNIFLAMFIYSFIESFTNGDHTLQHWFRLDSPILQPAEWQVLLWALEILLAAFSLLIVIKPSKIWSILMIEVVLVNLVFSFILSIFLTIISKFFACL